MCVRLVGNIIQHACDLTIFDFIENSTAKLEVIALLIDGIRSPTCDVNSFLNILLSLDDSLKTFVSLVFRSTLGFNEETLEFNVDALKYSSRLWTVVLEISVLMAQFPSKEVAELSYAYRTLGLGYANLGSVLMLAGIPYDSHKANAICGSITAILTGLITAFCGPIAFVGLGVPNFVRILLKSQHHGLLIIASAFIGGIFVLLCDALIQALENHAVIPINVLTSIIGAPIVVLLIMRKLK